MAHERITRLFFLVATAALGVFAAGFGPGDGPLVFVDEEPLTLTWSQVQEGESVRVCDIGRDRLTNLRADLIYLSAFLLGATSLLVITPHNT